MSAPRRFNFWFAVGCGDAAGVIQQVLAVRKIVVPSIDLIFQKDEACSSIGAGVPDDHQGALTHILFRAVKALGQDAEKDCASREFLRAPT